MKHFIPFTIGLAASLTLAAPAFAGEVRASHGGQYIAGSDAALLQGRSACAFSGLNDEYYIYDLADAARVQSYGQDVANGSLFYDPYPQDYAGPGTARPILGCNPNSGFAE